MNAATAEAGWLDILFDPHDAGEVWTAIFHRLADLARSTAEASAALHQATVDP